VTPVTSRRTIASHIHHISVILEGSTMKTSTWTRVVGVALALGLAVTACGTSDDNETGGGGGDQSFNGLRVMVPNSPGSGYDTTARIASKALEDAGLARNVQVFNVVGAGGTVGLQRLVNEKDQDDLLMQMGLGVVGAVYTNNSPATLRETTPVARLIEEAEAIVVPKGSPYTDIEGLVAAWQAEPGTLPVGGASAPGGPDHLTPMLLAKAVGIAPKEVNYVSYDGGGELLAGVLGGKVAFAATGVGEVAEQAKAGEVKILAVTSEKAVEGVDAPTLKEADIDLVFANWRGIVAPPGISAEQQQAFVGLVTDLHDSAEWKAALEEKGWVDAFLTGDEFAAFLSSENDRVAGVLSELGLT
jgi:putative tricarboxylic transport membrane protein